MMGLIVPASKSGISEHFAARLNGLPHSPEAVAYAIGVLGKRKWRDGDDLSDVSLCIVFQDALLKRDFVGFQRIGDWVLFAEIVVPDHIKTYREVAENLARLSYYECFRLMGQQWRVYEELADELPKFTASARQRLA